MNNKDSDIIDVETFRKLKELKFFGIKLYACTEPKLHVITWSQVESWLYDKHKIWIYVHRILHVNTFEVYYVKGDKFNFVMDYKSPIEAKNKGIIAAVYSIKTPKK